jgi:hypothetical protein
LIILPKSFVGLKYTSYIDLRDQRLSSGVCRNRVQKQGAETGCRNKVQKQGAGPHRQQRRKYAMQIVFMPDSRKENMAFGFVYFVQGVK